MPDQVIGYCTYTKEPIHEGQEVIYDRYGNMYSGIGWKKKHNIIEEINFDS